MFEETMKWKQTIIIYGWISRCQHHKGFTENNYKNWAKLWSIWYSTQDIVTTYLPKDLTTIIEEFSFQPFIQQSRADTITKNDTQTRGNVEAVQKHHNLVFWQYTCSHDTKTICLGNTQDTQKPYVGTIHGRRCERNTEIKYIYKL
jgi:hypothetical protein